MKTLRCFAFFLGFLFLNATSVCAQTAPLVGKELILNGAATFPEFSADFYENQLFLLGESHGVDRPQALDLALFQHLNERVGVRHYVAEVDPAKAYYLNRYLETGQDSLLALVFRSWVAENAQWANREFYQKLQTLRAWNAQLPARRKIRFIGIDAVQDAPLVARQLTELTANRTLPNVARALRDSLVRSLMTQKRSRQTDSLRAGWAGQWLAEMSPRTYRNAPGMDALDLDATLSGLVAAHTHRKREPIIFENFRSAVRRWSLERAKLYGFWGYTHVLQAPVAGGFQPFAALVRASDLPMAHKTVSIVCRYVDSFMMLPSAYLPPMWQQPGKTFSRVDKFNDNGPMMAVAGLDTLLTRSRPNSTTLFRLAGTTFGQQPIKVNYAAFMPPSQQLNYDENRPTTDYFQYVLLVRNSDMTTPIKE